MFHVEHLAQLLDLSGILARARQQQCNNYFRQRCKLSKEWYGFKGLVFAGLGFLCKIGAGAPVVVQQLFSLVLPAPFYPSAWPMSSLFCGCGANYLQLCESSCQTPCPPWQYTGKAQQCQGLFAASPGIIWQKRAPIIVQFRSDCQVLFTQLLQINQLTSLRGDGIIVANLGRPGQPRDNLRKFWTITENKT